MSTAPAHGTACIWCHLPIPDTQITISRTERASDAVTDWALCSWACTHQLVTWHSRAEQRSATSTPVQPPNTTWLRAGQQMSATDASIGPPTGGRADAFGRASGASHASLSQARRFRSIRATRLCLARPEVMSMMVRRRRDARPADR